MKETIAGESSEMRGRERACVCMCSIVVFLFLFTFGEVRSDFARGRRSELEMEGRNVSVHFAKL